MCSHFLSSVIIAPVRLVKDRYELIVRLIIVLYSTSSEFYSGKTGLCLLLLCGRYLGSGRSLRTSLHDNQGGVAGAVLEN